MTRAKGKYERHLPGPVSTPIKITVDLDGDGVPAAPATWIELPDGAGSSVTYKDATGTSVTLTATSLTQAWNVHAREITSTSGAINFGAPEQAPLQGPAGVKGATGATGPTGPTGATGP